MIDDTQGFWQGHNSHFSLPFGMFQVYLRRRLQVYGTKPVKPHHTPPRNHDPVVFTDESPSTSQVRTPLTCSNPLEGDQGVGIHSSSSVVRASTESPSSSLVDSLANGQFDTDVDEHPAQELADPVAGLFPEGGDREVLSNHHTPTFLDLEPGHEMDIDAVVTAFPEESLRYSPQHTPPRERGRRSMEGHDGPAGSIVGDGTTMGVAAESTVEMNRVSCRLSIHDPGLNHFRYTRHWGCYFQSCGSSSQAMGYDFNRWLMFCNTSQPNSKINRGKKQPMDPRQRPKRGKALRPQPT